MAGTKELDPRPSPLKAFIGMDKGKPTVFVCSFPMRRLSSMHMQGKPLSQRVLQFLETGEGDITEVLEDLDKYYNHK